jgi:CRISPR system Cascade subunit CasA
MGFNVFWEPWLPVVPLDGSEPVEVGIFEALCGARRYRRLVGSTPTMTAALHRILLAVVHRAYGPKDRRAWAQLWYAEPGLRPDLLEAYHARFSGRFDLFDARYPFLQCPGLRDALEPKPGSRARPRTAQDAKVLMAFRSGHRTLFEHITDAEPTILDAAEAARWLVTVQNYDTGGTKNPYQAERSSMRGLGNYTACTLVEGTNLHETLVLNTLIYRPGGDSPSSATTAEDCPVWELPEPPGPNPDKRVPRGWTDVLTWPARRVLLLSSGDAKAPTVDRVMLCPGTRVDLGTNGSPESADLVRFEHMAAFAGPWTSDRRGAGVEPVRLDDLKGVWRHARDLLFDEQPRWRSAFMAGVVGGERETLFPATEPVRHRPLALAQIADAAEMGFVPADAIYTLRVFGQRLGAQATKVDAWYEESVPAPVALIRSRDAAAGVLVGLTVTLAADLGAQLRGMVREFRRRQQPPTSDARRRSKKDPADSVATGVEIEYWPKLTGPFHGVLRDLSGPVGRGDLVACRPVLERWRETVRAVADRAAEAWALTTGRRERALLESAAVYDAYLGARRARIEVFNIGLDEFAPLGVKGEPARG